MRDPTGVSSAVSPVRPSDGGAASEVPSVAALSSGTRRTALVSALTFLAASLAVWALPFRFLREPIQSTMRIPLGVVGLDATWRFYAPNPRTDSFEVYAYVERADGPIERYDFPDTTDNLLGTHWTARWAEYEESLALFEGLRPAAAARIAEVAAETGRVLAVEIVGRIAPGPTDPSGNRTVRWGPEEVLYRLTLEEAK